MTPTAAVPWSGSSQVRRQFTIALRGQGFPAFRVCIGGLLSDRVAPVATWYGGLALGLAAVVGFLLLARRLGRQNPQWKSG